MYLVVLLTIMTESTTDFKKLAELIAPEKHLCIKCKQQLAKTGIICDNCITKITNLIAEFGLTKKEKKQEIITGDNS
jgi:predicted amidophosphoribosyltransferase